MTLSKKQESCKEIYQSYTGVFSGGRTTNPMALTEQMEQYKRRWGKYLPTNLESIILDIGCGSGEFLIFLSDFGYINLEGIDISLDQIESAKIHGLKNVFVADAIPFLKQTEKKFDIVSVLNLLEHLTRDELFELLDLVVSKLYNGGVVLGVVPNSKSLFGARVRYADITHENSFTPESLYQLFHAVGLSEVRIYEHGPLIHNIPSLLRWFVWQITRFMIWVILMAEGGESGDRVYTQNMMFTARKSE